MDQAKTYLTNLLKHAGITVNGPNDFDVQVTNEKLYRRVLVGGSLALGESYMDGWWDVKSIDQFFDKVLSADLESHFKFSLPNVAAVLEALAVNVATKERSKKVGQMHYDVGNELYQAMLDPALVYTCGYWKDAQNLAQAQQAKMDLIARKIGLTSGQHILDIGCGWGSFLQFAARKYGARGTGVTVSKNQVELAKKLSEGLPVEILLQDYRDTQGSFDHIVSLGMFEHVGVKNYRTYFQKAHALLKDDGFFLLHTIGFNRSVVSGEPWLSKYIFPNSMVPSVAQIGKAIEGLFVMEDWHNFGADYDKTLMAWFANFDAAWPALKKDYSERFYRMWKYYLLSCAGMFRARQTQLWQVVLSKKGVKGGYRSVR